MELFLEAVADVIVEQIINDIEQRLVLDICEPIVRRLVAEVQEEEERTEMNLAVKNYMDRNIL